ncbi:MAG: aldo/keto reductase, partial [Phenylobacterium sp.]
LGMGQGASTEQAADLVRAALDLGISFIDTARAYNTEEAVGQGVRGRWDQVFISTKASVTARGFDGAGGGFLSPQALTESLELSLGRLGVDRIDLFNLHGVTAAQYPYGVEVLLPELQRQQQAGKIRFLGITEAFIGDTRHEMLAQACLDGFFDVVMVGFNLLNPSARQRVFPLTLAQDVGTLIMFAVRRALSDPQAVRDVVAQLVADGQVDAALVDPADPLGFLGDEDSVIEAAYRFCRHEPGANVVLTGTGSLEHLKANIAAIQAPPLPPAVTDRLAALFGQVDSVSGN